MGNLFAALLTVLALAGAGQAVDIDDVTGKQLESVMESEDFLAVYWYTKNCKTCERVLTVLERLTNEVAEAGVTVVKVNDKKAAKAQAIRNFPALTFFKGGDAKQYEGDLMNSDSILDFLASPGSTDLPDQIEDVTASQLEALVHDKTYVAVFFFTGNRESSTVLAGLETVDEDAAKLGIAFVKINDLELVAEYNLGKLPALVYYRHTIPILYQGDLANSADVLEWLIQNRHSGDGEDIIEEVDSTTVQTMVQAVENIAVLFYDAKSRRVDQLMENLEMIDDDCDTRGIHFVKISEAGAGSKFGIDTLPTLVFFRSNVPNIFDGELLDGAAVLQWLLTHLESDEIEEVSSPMLANLVKDSRHLVVLFYKKGDKEIMDALEALETIDDDFDRLSVGMVKVHEPEAAAEWGITQSEAIVYFENGIPFIYNGNVKDEREVLRWVKQQFEGDEIEEINPKMLEKIVKSEVGSPEQFGAHADAAVLFYKRHDPFSNKVLKMLENIDDECDTYGIIFVKIAEENKAMVASELGIIDLPALVYFEDRIPHLYDGDLRSQDDVLNWLVTQMETDEIEEVTDAMLDKLIETNQFVTAIFYDKGDKTSIKALAALETIDDDLDVHNIAMLKMSDTAEAKNYGVKEFPSIIMFKNKIPELYSGDTTNEVQVLEWIFKLAEVSSTSGGVFGLGAASAADIEAPAPHVFKPKPEKPPPKAEKPQPKAEKPPPKAEKPPPQVEKPPPQVEKHPPQVGKPPTKVEKPPPVVEKPSAKVDAPPPLVKEPPKPVKLKKGETSESTKESKPKKDPEPKPKEEPVKVEETVKIAEEVVSEETMSQIDTSTPGHDAAEETGSDNITDAIKNGNNVVAFFYESLDKISKKIISGIVKVEGHFSGKDIKFLTVDANDMPEMNLPTVPSLVYFKNGQPTVYEENLMNEDAIKAWVELELQSNQDVIEDLSTEQVHGLMEKEEYVMVYIYAPECEACDEAIKQLEEIDDDADAVGVKFVKTEDADFAEEYGISEFPAIIYFEHEQPSIYDGDPGEETELLTWLLYQMKEDTIENINRELMTKMIEDFEFLAVFFYTAADPSSGKVLRHLELIDDSASEYGVRLVKIDDALMSKKYGHREPPGLGYFRKGNYIKYDGDLLDDEEMLDWLTDPNTMEISDQIEKVNKKMFEKLISRNEFLAVMFYSESDCKQCDSVLEELENIDDDAEASGIPIVKLEDKTLAKNIGVFALPAIVFFRNFGEEPTIYAGDLKREDSILEWLLIQKDPSNEAIEDMDGEALRKAIDKSDAVAVFVYTQEGCETCLPILQALENIDDDTDRQKISMVKTIDAAFAQEVGIEKFPGLVFFKDGVPNLYEGDLMLEEEVLDWLIEMKVESHIELITRPMLESMVEEIQYLAVFFYKLNCRTCDQVIVELENIDDDCDMYGIQMVKLKDPQLAKRYGIKTFPALVYFRNGNPLTYDGDLKNEESVLEWLIDDDNRELEDEIEAVNYRMLDKLLETSPFMAVFFYDDECIECEAILEQLENIDDEADIYGIDFVKNNDPHAAKQYNIYNTPALVYFRKMTPIVYDGDLMDDERILEWLTSQDVFEIKDEIEEVNRKMLEKLLDENEFVAVYFYEDDCAECNEVLEGLERIDDETDALDITFVKINDPRYAKKYGVNKLPALVYFRRKFPSIYRDSLLGEAEVLDWLTTNRYKQMELGVFMYAIIALAVTFMFYTAFLMFGLKPREPEKKKEE